VKGNHKVPWLFQAHHEASRVLFLHQLHPQQPMRTPQVFQSDTLQDQKLLTLTVRSKSMVEIFKIVLLNCFIIGKRLTSQVMKVLTLTRQNQCWQYIYGK
jgi:hypothetical protein